LLQAHKKNRTKKPDSNFFIGAKLRVTQETRLK